MKRLVYVLSAAALLTVGIFACSKEQNIEKNLTSTESLEVKRGSSPVYSEDGFMELQLPQEIRRLNLVKSRDLKPIVVEKSVTAIDLEGNTVQGVAKLHMNPSAGKITRFEISKNIAELKGLNGRSLVGIGDDLDVDELINGLGACIAKCNQDEIDQLNQGCGDLISPEECVELIKANARKCRAACYVGAGLDVIIKVVPWLI